MQEWAIDQRLACAALTAVGALVLWIRPRPRVARPIWMILLVLAIVNGLTLTLLPANLININLVHHYLGAKYPVPYGSFYSVFNAAVGRPQIGLRDLDRPPAVVRQDPREQRAYCIELLRRTGVEFSPLAPLEDLLRGAEEAGALDREAQRILDENLAASEIDRFRRDARWASGNLVGRDLTTDYGFNGSPFYSLVRHVDPTLYRPFGRGAAWLNLLWQISAGLALAWLAGQALELTLEERMAAATFVFASWDYAGWLLPGLVFAGLWLPVALALVALRRGRPAFAGVAIAWAGLAKLFPFVLLLPAVARVVRAVLLRFPVERSTRRAVRLLISSAIAVVALGSLALLSGRSWSDFLHKILVQFQSEAYLLNSVSFSQGLLALGNYGTRSLLPTILAVGVLAFLVLLFARTPEESFHETLPRRCLVLLSACGWLVHTWFNYYSIAPLLLLPLVARRHRVGAALAALSIAVAFAFPEFGRPLMERPGLHMLKLAPYLLIPAWLVALELRESRFGRVGRRIVWAAAAIALIAVAGEALRLRSIPRLDARAGALLDRGQAEQALPLYERLTRIAPFNAMAQMNKGIANAMQGRSDEAGVAFAQAVALDPESPPAHSNYARWLIGVNRLEEAATELEAARELVPYDDRILYDLARVRLRQGRHADARGLLSRALELQPGNRAVRELLERLTYNRRSPGS